MSIETRRPSWAPIMAWSGALLFAVALAWFVYHYAVVWGAPAAGARTGPVLINVGLFSLFALHHSLLARSRVKDRLRSVVPAELERSLYSWTASLLFILVCWQWQPVGGVLYRLDGVWALLGLVIQGAGLVLTLAAGATIGFLDLAGVRDVERAGRGAPPAPPALQTRGLYGFVRHPLYFAWVLLVFGAPVMTATRASFAIVSTAYLVLAIPMEERGLLAIFGPAYHAYRRKVRWRMLPGLY